MRLDKYIKHTLCISRSEAIELINKKRILVDGKPQSKDYDVKEKMVVMLDGKQIVYKEYYYYMLNKPAGYVSSTSNRDGIPVTDIIKERNDLFPVGRLDKDTEGLLILTNDGGLAHNLTSPKKEIEKKYYVKSKYNIRKEDVDSFKDGVSIVVDGAIYKCMSVKLEIISDRGSYVYIKEGKFHQVKEMFKAINNEVVYLKRVKEGELELDPNLKIGEYKELSEEEISKLKSVK